MGKVYNISGQDLGKIRFFNGSLFVRFSFENEEGQKVETTLILPTVEEAVRRISAFAMEQSQRHMKDPIKFHNDIVDWLIENWMDPGIVTLKQEMYERYGFDEFRDADPVEWVKSEPEVLSLALVHITRFTNGYVKVPVNNLELTVRFINEIIGLNFWEEGNPHNSDPIV